MAHENYRLRVSGGDGRRPVEQGMEEVISKGMAYLLWAWLAPEERAAV